jgi:hypothetical protein
MSTNPRKRGAVETDDPSKIQRVDDCKENLVNSDEDLSSDAKTDTDTSSLPSAAPSRCDICFEGPSECRTVDYHSCTTCKSDSWSICEICNESMLSKACPFCKSNYAARPLYTVPNLPLYNLSNPQIDAKERQRILIKMTMVDKLINMLPQMGGKPPCLCVVPCLSKTNTTTTITTGSASSNSDDGDIYSDLVFLLPQDEKESMVVTFRTMGTILPLTGFLEDAQLSSTSSSTPATSAVTLQQLNGGSCNCYMFNNETWDFIERYIENGQQEGPTADQGEGTETATASTSGGGDTVPVVTQEVDGTTATNNEGTHGTHISVLSVQVLACKEATKVLMRNALKPCSRLYLPFDNGVWADIDREIDQSS